MNKGVLYVISGPSGVGKGTIIKGLFDKHEERLNLEFSVSATTRAPRPGEVNGVEYFFISKEDFATRVDNDEFIEWAMFSDNCYGTLKNYVNSRLDSGKNVILDIEPQGAMQIMEKDLNATFIFLAPPSIEELTKRLTNRGTETPEQIEKRLSASKWELSTAKHYDFVVTNNKIEDAVEEVTNIIDRKF